ncbi:hypothetical protein HWV62_21120 [Athelia sp. TMB]|nr:hypothetical protein HWV62_21120 [Athelia sp. TMB]
MDFHPTLTRLDGEQMQLGELHQRKLSIAIESVCYFNDKKRRNTCCAVLLKTHFRLRQGDLLYGASEYGEMPIHITGRHPADIQTHLISPQAGPRNGNITLDSMLEAFDDLPAIDRIDRLMSTSRTHEGWCFKVDGQYEPHLAKAAYKDASKKDQIPTIVGLNAAIKLEMEPSMLSPTTSNARYVFCQMQTTLMIWLILMRIQVPPTSDKARQ